MYTFRLKLFKIILNLECHHINFGKSKNKLKKKSNRKQTNPFPLKVILFRLKPQKRITKKIFMVLKV